MGYAVLPLEGEQLASVLVIEPRSVAELNRDLIPVQARSGCASPAPTGCARFGPTETGRGLLSGVSRRNLALNAVFVDAARPIFSVPDGRDGSTVRSYAPQIRPDRDLVT